MSRLWLPDRHIRLPRRMGIVSSYAGGGAPPPAWTPTDEASLVFFIDGHDPANGVIPNDGDRVPSLVDKSASAITLTQATTTKQGLYVANAQDGWGGIDFDPTAFQKYSSAAASYLDPSSPFTFVAVVKVLGPYATYFLWIIAGNTNWHGTDFVYNNAAGYLNVIFANDQFGMRTGDYPPAASFNDPHAFVFEYSGAGLADTSFTNHYNGSVIPTLSTATFSSNWGTTHWVGNYTAADDTLGFDGVVLALMAFSDKNATLLSNIQNWIATRYPSL